VYVRILWGSKKEKRERERERESGGGGEREGGREASGVASLSGIQNRRKPIHLFHTDSHIYGNRRPS